MPLPSWLMSAPSWLPYVEKGATVLAGGLSVYEAFKPNPGENLLNEIIQGELELRNQNIREAGGNFTPARVQEIRQASNPRLNRLASRLAQRGLSTSEAGVDFLTQAQEAPFLEAQQTAKAELSESNQRALEIGKLFMGDNSFASDVGKIVQNMTYLRGLGDDDDPTIDGALGDLESIAEDLGGDLVDTSVKRKLGQTPSGTSGDEAQRRGGRLGQKPIPEVGSLLDK
ncbi:MAG: hypothetical protein OXG15_07400 [Gammaproteobacteria bacterium]|nr:hypothetical protein [Gammaproteobacteria bacterium]